MYGDLKVEDKDCIDRSLCSTLEVNRAFKIGTNNSKYLVLIPLEAAQHHHCVLISYPALIEIVLATPDFRADLTTGHYV